MKSAISEIGGYLPLELGYLGGRESEPFNNIEEVDNVRFNLARYAICYAVQEGEYKKIYIPLYMCVSVGEALKKYGIEYDTYSIREDFMPLIDEIENDSCILICNYYGIQGNEFYKICQKKYRNIIFDNTQAFYQPPLLDEHIYNVYSPRKFVGCIDGAYLIKKHLKKKSLCSCESWKRGGYLLKSIDGGTNYAYSMYLQSEDDAAEEGMCMMSPFTRKYLDSVQYEEIKEKRKRNFQMLVKLLNGYNRLKITDEKDLCPMVYPLLPKGNVDRNALIQKRVYVPQWWKWVIEQINATMWEIDLSKNLLPFPIDHRYEEQDMKLLYEYITKFYSN